MRAGKRRRILMWSGRSQGGVGRVDTALERAHGVFEGALDHFAPKWRLPRSDRFMERSIERDQAARRAWHASRCGVQYVNNNCLGNCMYVRLVMYTRALLC
jgi:hypothetical protein